MSCNMSPKYIYDDKQVKFRRSTRTFGGVMFRVLKYFLVSIALAAVYYGIFSLLFSTDTERRLRQENRMYSKVYPEMVKKDRLLSDVVAGLQMRDDEIYRDIFHTEAPNVERLSSVDFLAGGDTLRDADIVAITSDKLDMLEDCAEKVERNFRKIAETCSREDFIAPPMRFPLKGFSYTQTGATTGAKINPFYKVKVEHHGLDMIAHSGTEVYSAGKGVVSEVTRSKRGQGNVVEITHDGGYLTRYAHLDDILVRRGSKVDEQTVIGRVGTSGMTIAPHLHYEVLKDGKILDPVNCFFAEVDPYEYADILIMSVMTGQSMD